MNRSSVSYSSIEARILNLNYGSPVKRSRSRRSMPSSQSLRRSDCSSINNGVRRHPSISVSSSAPRIPSWREEEDDDCNSVISDLSFPSFVGLEGERKEADHFDQCNGIRIKCDLPSFFQERTSSDATCSTNNDHDNNLKCITPPRCPIRKRSCSSDDDELSIISRRLRLLSSSVASKGGSCSSSTSGDGISKRSSATTTRGGRRRPRRKIPDSVTQGHIGVCN